MIKASLIIASALSSLLFINKLIAGDTVEFVNQPPVFERSTKIDKTISVIPSILCIVLLCDDQEVVEPKEPFFKNILNPNHNDDFGLTRQVPLAPLTSREAVVYGSNSYPIIVRNESQSPDFRGTPGGWGGAAKYGYLFIRQGSMDELNEMQKVDSGLLAVHYESPADPQGPYNSPWAKKGSGGIFSHGQLFLKLGDRTTGGDMKAVPTTYNQADFPQWVGHVIPTVPATLKNNEAALFNDDSQYITYELNEKIDESWFPKSTNSKCTPTENCTGAAFIWTPNSATSTFADEASNPATGFTNAERVRIRRVDYNQNTVTVSRAVVPNGTGKIFGSSAPNGGSFPRLAGDKIMMIAPGQGSVQFLNDAMNMHPDFGFKDAAGNTYFEAMKKFYNGNLKRDAKGIFRPVTLDASASDVTEEFHPNSGKFKIDFNGDGVEDDGFVGGINRWKEAHELGTARYTNLIHGGGGTGEAVLKNMEFQQIEHVSESVHFADDQDQTFHDMGGYILRALYHKYYASHAHYNACVTKHSTKAFNDTGKANSNDAFYTKMGLCLIALTNIAPLNYNNTVKPNADHRDNWWTIGAVDLNTDTAITNTFTNQSSIKQHRGWGGSPISAIQNISDTDFDSLIPAFEWDFTENKTGEPDYFIKLIQQWQLGGSNRGNAKIEYDSVNKRMVVKDLTKSFSFGTLFVRPNNSILQSGDSGKDIVVRYHIGANTHGEIQQALGDDDDKDFSLKGKRAYKKIYLNPDQSIYFDTSFTASTFDVAESGYESYLKLALSRLNDSDTLKPEFYIYKIQVFKGDDIDNSVWVREFDSMVAVCNGKGVDKEIKIAAGKSLKFPLMQANQLPSWANSGEEFNVNNSLRMPKKTCGVLIKKH